MSEPIDARRLIEGITATCPECGTTGDVPSSWQGLEIECKECDERFIVNGGDTE